MSSPLTISPEPRCSFGVEGLDSILGGGLPRNRIYLMKGAPGTGKTTLALQFLQEGVALGEDGLYITLSETKEELESVAGSHGWDLAGIDLFELSAMEEKLKGEMDSTFFHPSEVELNRTTEILLAQAERTNPARVVFDSLSEMRLMAETSLRYRRQILRLKQYFAGRKCTVLFLDDGVVNDHDVQSLVHGVLSLRRLAPEFGAFRRQVCIEKIRGVSFSEGYHDYKIGTGGVQVFPRLVANLHRREFTRAPLASENAGLDQLLGGGLDRGTSTMLLGPPGTGKSTLASAFAHVAAGKQQKVLWFSFDEVTDTLLVRTAQLGLDLRPAIDAGLLRLEQIDPAEISPGELSHRIRQAVLNEDVGLVIIDSLNGYMNAMPAERHLNLQLHELLAFLNQQGVITIMVLAQQGLIGTMESAVDLTYLADTVVLFRYFEAFGAVKQAISIIKKRSGNHERTIRQFSLDAQGIQVGAPLTNMQGVLTGVPMLRSGAN